MPDAGGLTRVEIAVARLETTVAERTRARDEVDKQLSATIRDLSGAVQGLSATVQGLGQRVQTLEASLGAKTAKGIFNLFDPQNLIITAVVVGWLSGKVGLNPADLLKAFQ